MRQHQIDLLSETHREAAVLTLAEAFFDDPPMQWLFKDAEQRKKRLPLLFDWLFESHLKHGIVLGNPAAEVTLLWASPGQIHPHPLHDLLELPRLLKVFGTALYRADILNRSILKHLPTGEEWHYLRVVGVQPRLQGRGLGRAGMYAGIELASQAGMPTCLETANPDNVDLYESMGFEVISTWRLPLEGPQFWTMVRRPDVLLDASMPRVA